MSRALLSNRLDGLEQALTPRAGAKFDLFKHSEGHPKQLAFTSSKAKFRTGCCSRRSGKTEGCAAALLEPTLARPGCVGLYLTKTRVNAKRLIWGILKRINRDFALGGNPKEAELCMELPNGSAIYLGGVNNKDEIEKFRGMPLVVVVLDEGQILVTYMKELIEEVLAPALMDYDGSLLLVGTPGPVPSGYFYECLNSDGWEHFSWTVFDNPWILKKSGKTPREHMEAELKRRGVAEDDATIQREWFGRWAYDPNALVFKYSSALNDYETLPTTKHGEWQCLIAGDVGWDDADALGVLEWNTALPDLWLTHEDVMPKQTITQLGNKLKALAEKRNPMAIVIDFGGLGKKIAEELKGRWGLNVEAAEKERKLEHIELLNDAMRTGVFHAKKDSRFAQDCMLVEWDKSKPEKPKISERFHSDACDMVLYGYRKAYHWLSTPAPEEAPRIGTPAWHQREAERLAAEGERLKEEALEEALRAKQEKDEAEEFGGYA